jgi:lipoate-protein ligase A
VNGGVGDLYDYVALRATEVSTMFVPRIERALLVLGSSQSLDVLDGEVSEKVTLRRRKGGGGLVLLHPNDIWVDWWIPANDEQWSKDVHVSSIRAGMLWRDVVASRVSLPVTVHEGSLEGELAHRMVCFAGKGPGEVFVEGRKAVGVTQWRVREGVFLSTVLATHDSREVLSYLREVPKGLHEALNGYEFSNPTPIDTDAIIDELRRSSGARTVLHPTLSP